MRNWKIRDEIENNEIGKFLISCAVYDILAFKTIQLRSLLSNLNENLLTSDFPTQNFPTSRFFNLMHPRS